MAYTHIDPGREIEISTRLYSSKDHGRVAELVKLPRTELGELEEASVAQEKAIFLKFSEIEAEWLNQAAEPAAIRKAKQYLMALPVNHTSNQWKKDQYGNYERSNRVYKMTYRFYDRTHYDRTRQETVTDAWYLSWHLHYNTICNPTPDLTGDGWQLAGQSDKRFTEKADMERYLQGRITKPTPTCLRRSPRPSQRDRMDVSPSMAYYSPAIRWRLPWKNGWKKCFPFWRTTRPCWRSRCPPPIKTHHKRRSRLWHRSCIPRP